MSDIYKVQAVWSGFPGGPGVNTFYVSEIPSELTAFKTFYEAIKSGIPSTVSIQVVAENVSVDAATGVLTGGYSAPEQVKTTCLGGGDYASGVGYTVRWNTGAIIGRRRLMGHTYIVPLVASAFDDDGTPKDAFQTTVVNAAVALNADCGGTLGVWHRPKAGLGGDFRFVSGATVASRPAFLSSRRG